MVDAPRPSSPSPLLAAWPRVATAAVCLGLGVAAVLFLIESLAYRFGTPGALGPTFWNKQAWYWIHTVLAIPTLLLAPLQFSTTIRRRWPALHRWTGRIYLASALAAAVVAVILGAGFEDEGQRVPLVLLSSVWFFFSACALATALRRDFVAHRLFILRSLNCALAFVWIRLLGLIPGETMFPFLADPDMQDATREWITAVVPILLLEIWIGWLPQARGIRPR